ncbi:MAG: hypothetical protein ACLTDC_10715 [Lachnospiraceae bacterium]
MKILTRLGEDSEKRESESGRRYEQVKRTGIYRTSHRRIRHRQRRAFAHVEAVN